MWLCVSCKEPNLPMQAKCQKCGRVRLANNPERRRLRPASAPLQRPQTAPHAAGRAGPTRQAGPALSEQDQIKRGLQDRGEVCLPDVGPVRERTARRAHFGA